jgi:predicted enzyme related to lactoylglutathione lyase
MTHGRFCWYELLTTDPDSAVPFYEGVVGWGTSPWEGGELPYTMWTRGETPIGGVMQLPEEAAAGGAPSHWLAYILTADVDATVDKALDLGGCVLKEATKVPGEGTFAVLADPQGAAFAVLSPTGEMPAPEGGSQVGAFSWHELATTDYEAAFEFYSALFGWEKTDAMDMGEMGIYQMYGQAGNTYGGMYNKPAEMPGPPAWLCYATVDDVNEAVGRVADGGGRVVNGPMTVPGGDLIAQCLDPQGAMFAIHSAGNGES